MTESKPLGRREFLNRTARVGAAVAASTASLSATETKGRVRPKKKYRVGVVGVTGKGGFGHDVDRAWLDFPQCELVGVADHHEGGRDKAAERLGITKKFADYRDLLDEKLDIVAFCNTWIDDHAEMALAAAERGLHIYMEKPFCPTLEQADSIVAACEKKGVKFGLALPTTYSPKFAMAKKLIADGAIGRVLEYRGRGKEDGRGGGEDLWVLGTHVLDMIRQIGGAPRWCFANVTQGGESVTKQHVTAGKIGLERLAGDAIRSMYGMADGSTAHFHSYRNMRGNPWRYGLQVYGSRGVIEIQEGPMADVKILQDPSWSPGRSGKTWQDVSSAGIDKPEPLEGKHRNRHFAAIQNLIEAIETNAKVACDARDARGATEMIAAVFESHRLGCATTMPLKTRVDPLTLLE